MKQALLLPWLTFLREFIVFSLGGETQEEPRRLPELRRQTLSRSRKLEFTGQSTEQDRASQRNNFRDYCKNQVRDNVVWSKVIAVRYWQDIRIGKPYHFLTVWM